MKLVLFDVNGTLVKDYLDVSEYVAESIRSIYGILTEVDLSKYDGFTSQEIAESVLLENGFPKEEIDAKLERYCEDLFYSYYNVAGHNKQIVLDGAESLLNELSRKGNALLGIATGEAERVARFRLEKVNFSKYFKIGSFGNDGKHIRQIIDKAVSSAKSTYGIDDGFFVSSAARALEEAKSAGISTIGVAADGKSYADLERIADAALASLKDSRKMLKAIGF